MNNTMGGKDKFNGDIQKPQSEDDTAGDNIWDSSDINDNNNSDGNTMPQMPNGDTPSGDMPSGQMPDGFGTGQMPDGSQDATQTESENGGNGEQSGFKGGQMQKPDGNFQPDNNGQTQPQGQNTISSSSWIATGISILVLALGLVFAFAFKRRK